MTEWKESKIKDFAEVKGGKRLPKGKQLTSVPTKHPYIRIRDLGKSKYLELNPEIEFVDDETQLSIARYIVNAGDILISVVGTIGLIGIVGESLDKANQTENCDKIINCTGIEPEYLYYYLISPFGQEEIKRGTVGAVQPKLPLKNVLDINVKYPAIAEQRKIVEILKKVDEKISINERINNNLLEQVTAKFQNMFGKYDNDKSVYRTLGTIAKFKYGTMPKKDKLGTGGHLAFSGYQVVGSYPEVMYPEPQLIIVARGVGGCGEIKYTPANCYLTNLAIAIITNCVEHDDYLYHYLRLHDTKVMNTGSAQPQITVSTLEKYVIPIPTEDELLVFSNFVKPFKELYRANVATNERLTALRDTLLPKLMSSELDVSDLDL